MFTQGRKKIAMSAIASSLPIRRRFPWRIVRRAVAGFVAFLVIGNLVIFGAFQYLSHNGKQMALPELPGIKNLTRVDSHVWRGSAPSADGYKALAERGVRTIVDVRAEDLVVDVKLIESLGMKLVRIPMRDGQAPGPGQVKKFLAAVSHSKGLVYLHCGAGVGRTGTMAAAYLVSTGRTSALEALRRNLSVGPPSLEQIVFAAGLDKGETAARPNAVVTAISRVLDGPRRILVRVRGSYK
jgi:protein-tyrosine phosphatase